MSLGRSSQQICSWEFCARRHEELIPKRLLIPQVADKHTWLIEYLINKPIYSLLIVSLDNLFPVTVGLQIYGFLVSQLGAVAQKYHAFTQNATANVSVPKLQNINELD
ncbi:Transcriptional corepressor SEUSS [Spatholobus suberectus]|nr:Transcriptional corepressor SEUSS [Spatholobus suberectus]